MANELPELPQIEATSNQKPLHGGARKADITINAVRKTPCAMRLSPGRRGQKKKDYFDNMARDWDDEHHTPEEVERTRIFAQKYFQLKKAETVLDVGCGTGRLIPQLKKMIGETGKLVELDFSIEMLKIGKNRYNFWNLFFVKGDGHVLPLKDCCIDTVICFAFFPHLSDKMEGMKAFARVLKPGGKLIIAHQMNREELNRFHGNVDGPVSNDLLPDENKIRELFKTVGFKAIEIREEPGLYLAAAYLDKAQ
jgi:SAM-dependent methyltransferase